MKDPSQVSSPGSSEPSLEVHLDSWKEIACYVKRDVSTVQRWEKREGMPIHRHVHDRRGSVYALSSELDAWFQSRRLRLDEEEKEHRAESPVDSEGYHSPTGLLQARRWLVALAVMVVAAVLVGLNLRGLRERLFARHAIPPVRALAVLPLANLSGDPEQEYFADGMTEALITELGKISSPRVISRQSVMQYKTSKKPLQEIAGELKVDAVLEGTVVRSGDRVRVTIHLSQASPERQLWAQQYDRSIRDILSLQAEIARGIADEIQVKLTSEERTRLANTSSVDPKALDDFLRAEVFAWKGDLPKGIVFFRRAVEQDPGYARAHAGLAWALSLQIWPWYEEGGLPAKEVLPEARMAAARALELDPLLADAHVSQAVVLENEWNWLEAEKEHQLALKLGPNSWGAHASYAWHLYSMGRFDEAKSQLRNAGELDPGNPVNRYMSGFVALFSREYDLAIKHFVDLDDDIGLGWAYGQQKMYSEAIFAFQRAARKLGRKPMVVANLAWAYGIAGRKLEAQKLIDELRDISRDRYVSPSAFVNAYVGLGDKNNALTWIERGYEEQDQGLTWLKVFPIWDPLCSEPRFQAVVRRMNFPQ